MVMAIMVVVIVSMAIVLVMHDEPPESWRMTPVASANAEWDAGQEIVSIRLNAIAYNDVAFEDARLLAIAPDLTSASFPLADLLWEAGNRTAPFACQGMELTMTAASASHLFAAGDSFVIRGALGGLDEGTWHFFLVYLPTGGQMVSVQVEVS